MADQDEEDSELDYHVTFPPAISAGATKEPVVMLFGWMGCVDKHLAKYSAIYQAMGYTTIRYIAPRSKLILGRSDSIREVARKLLELLSELGLEENPILLHVMSNGGSFVYRHMMELLTDERNAEFASLKVVGSILDSTPSEASILLGAKALYYSADRLTPLLVLGLFAMLLLAVVTFFIPERFQPDQTAATHVKGITESPSRSPQLFFYSTKDPLCDYRLVEEVIAKRRSAGVEVWQQCWDNTGHVTHFRVHQEQYIEKITQFVEFCLQQ